MMDNIPNIELFLAQQGNCFYCGNPMWATRTKQTKKDAPAGWTIDHFLPKSLGNGKNGNKVMCHSKCNMKKGNRLPSPEEFNRFKKLYEFIEKRRVKIRQLNL